MKKKLRAQLRDNIYAKYPDVIDADIRALQEDWKAIGDDMWNAIHREIQEMRKDPEDRY